MIILYALLSLFLAAVWIDYFRQIDIFERDHIKIALISFLFGCISPFLVLYVNDYWLTNFHWEITGEPINDFLYCFLHVGMVEEIAKVIPFLMFLVIFRSKINEPLDIISGLCLSALGFAAVENILYIKNYGVSVFEIRSIVSTTEHLFFTSLVGYGWIWIKYRRVKNEWYFLLVFLLLAAFFHGFYDFWLLSPSVNSFGIFISLVFFLVSVSWMATMLNNSINFSPHFTHFKYINSSRLFKRLIIKYGIVLLGIIVISIIESPSEKAVLSIVKSLFLVGMIMFIVLLRLSYFHHRKNYWEKLQLTLPFSFASMDYSTGFVRGGLAVQGDATTTNYLSTFLTKDVTIYPIKNKRSTFDQPLLMRWSAKKYLDELAIFIAEEKNIQGVKHHFLIEKNSGETMVKDKYPIMGLYEISADQLAKNTSKQRFKFITWVYVVPQNS